MKCNSKHLPLLFIACSAFPSSLFWVRCLFRISISWCNNELLWDFHNWMRVHMWCTVNKLMNYLLCRSIRSDAILNMDPVPVKSAAEINCEFIFFVPFFNFFMYQIFFSTWPDGCFFFTAAYREFTGEYMGNIGQVHAQLRGMDDTEEVKRDRYRTTSRRWQHLIQHLALKMQCKCSVCRITMWTNKNVTKSIFIMK